MCRAWIRKIIKHRRGLLRRNNPGRKGTPEMESAIKHMAYWAENTKTLDRMLVFLSAPKNVDRLTLIIPKNKPEWWAEHEHLIFQGNVILGKTTKQFEINF
jgi:hypothetical protein